MQPPPPPNVTSAPSIPIRPTWLIVSGIIYLCTGLAAIIFPHIASIAIVQIISLLLIITGIASLIAAICDRHDTHRIMHGLLAFLRIIVGILILKKILVGLAIFTIILAAFFLIEGIFSIVAAVKLTGRGHWVWLLFNGIIALALGILIFIQYPITASWVIGLLYGVNAVFGGTALLILGCGGITFSDTQRTCH